MFKLAVSIVTYKHNVDEIVTVVNKLADAVYNSENTCCQVNIVDNHGSFNGADFIKKVSHFDETIISFDYIANPDNNGYGFGNNLALEKSKESDYFLVLNPDAFLNVDALHKAISYMEANDECVLLAPKILSKIGVQESGVKEYPSILVLLARLINLKPLNALCHKSLENYEARSVFRAVEPIDVNIISGCFMLFKTTSLKCLGGFDTRFFMYFEDFDLSLRAQNIGRVIYHPDVIITHLGGGAGRKGLNHVRFFIQSMVKFFHKHGWKII
ncbi:glycosyltransferase [Photobacterium lipolyticum]|uniref:glycosyltransferase n=1 Tax=Photobacterium lipolyticum TaxID=266810 RepID=UPI0011B228A1|nr:glycosyltransferase [Photobacterium lipolyticum]